MALLDRVKERIESDLSDAELQSMIDGVVAEIDQRYGAIGNPITLDFIGTHDHALGRDRRFLTFIKPIDEAQPLTVTEIQFNEETVLHPSDFRLFHGGRTMERLLGGVNPSSRWAQTVRVAYSPLAGGDQQRRDEVVIQIVQLQTNSAAGIVSERKGDWAETYAQPIDVATRREQLIASLAPRSGMVMA